MKTNKFLAAVLAAIVLSATFAGCTKKDEPPVAEEHHGLTMPTNIWFDGSDDSVSRANPRQAIINEINISRSMSRSEHQENGNNFVANRISEITEFYFPVLEIPEFELIRISMGSAGFIFHYAPIDKSVVCPYYYDEIGIEVKISRPDFELPRTFEQFVEINGLLLTADGFAYDEWSNLCAIDGEINGVHFTVTSSQAFADYELLRDIALQIIDTAELVDVEQELEVLRQSES
jgi:hypothetical protein